MPAATGKHSITNPPPNIVSSIPSTSKSDNPPLLAVDNIVETVDIPNSVKAKATEVPIGSARTKVITDNMTATESTPFPIPASSQTSEHKETYKLNDLIPTNHGVVHTMYTALLDKVAEKSLYPKTDGLTVILDAMSEAFLTNLVRTGQDKEIRLLQTEARQTDDFRMLVKDRGKYNCSTVQH